MKTRFKGITVTQWVGMAFELLFGIGLLLMAIMWSIDLGQGRPFFTDKDGGEMVAYEWVVLIVFYLLAVILLSLVVYELLFMPIGEEKAKGKRRELIANRLVEIDENKDEKTKTKPKSKKKN